MNYKKLLQKAILVFITALTIISIRTEAEEIKIIKAKEVWTIKNANVGPNPFLSSDGNYVAWSDTITGGKVYIAKVGTKEVIEIGQTKEFLGWLPESNEYLMTAEGFLSVKTKNIVSLLPKVNNKFIKNIRPRDFFKEDVPDKIITPFWTIQNGMVKKSFSSGEPNNIILFENITEHKAILFSNGVPIWENDRGGNIFSVIPVFEGEKLYIKLFALQPNIRNLTIDKNGKYYDLPEGTQFSWSPDGEKLIFARLEDNGYVETKGELFICNWDGTNVSKIVFEEQRIRRQPSFGTPDLITYSFYDENYNFCIGVAKLIDQKEEKIK